MSFGVYFDQIIPLINFQKLPILYIKTWHIGTARLLGGERASRKNFVKKIVAYNILHQNNDTITARFAEGSELYMLLRIDFEKCLCF